MSLVPSWALRFFALVFLSIWACSTAAGGGPPLRVGSKVFTEGVILAELATQLLQAQGIAAVHRQGLGGTQVLWSALTAGEIDIYPEYTGTIAEEILPHGAARDPVSMRAALAARGVGMSPTLGFNDTYAIGVSEALARRLGLRTISDLRAHPELRFGFSHEFMDRADGWPGLRDRYRLPQRDVRGLDHDLAYRGLASGAIDATDLYSTDAEIPYYRLRVLQDDLHYFPEYQAVWLYRADLAQRAPQALAALSRLEGRISEADMAAMNTRAKLDKVPESRVAADFLASRLGIETSVREEGMIERLLVHTREHLFLVAVSLAAAIIAAVPLGILAARRPRLGQVILGAAGVVQTIPSLALLVFMIPLLGIGAGPAISALFLYSLLPIVRNTYTGLADIPASLRESAEALGLPPRARLRLIELPLALRSILAGIKTSAVINVGTATLGALIGAGGYGQPILTGIRLDDVGLIMQGAVPAALLALAVQGLFDLVERAAVPRGLRIAAG
jgi:osmoprotectant transport system permease protein